MKCVNIKSNVEMKFFILHRYSRTTRFGKFLGSGPVLDYRSSDQDRTGFSPLIPDPAKTIGSVTLTDPIGERQI